MSRVGKKPVPVPSGVDVKISEEWIEGKGPKGSLKERMPSAVKAELKDNEVTFTRIGNEKKDNAAFGLARALTNNMVTGVSEGYSKVLEIVGTGYRAEMQGEKLVLYLGYSHPVEVQPPDGISFEVPRGGRAVTIQGIDKELVGETAARIRRKRPPEPYKGKGVRYQGEYVRRKAGKAGRVGA